ncbi:DUF1541 domain-containing protein [Peribacillus saganii]|uniref:DUF1541 domain-containing protein n=1 Tax=Peribacillus saganii TaxID=2303992 RepID=A0A372LL25_9BACI|nr:YdhK family protein [Peribacillus saganii]RFU67497.1 DUF1541 domain-containing protein [Peribacillus saganii]
MSKKWLLLFMSLITAVVLAACSDGGGNQDNQEDTKQEHSGHGNTNDENKEDESTDHGDHAGVNHSSSGEIPEGLKEAANPTYKVGSKAILTTDHMEGMKGAETTIVGAFDTTVYAVSYTPTTGGEKVTNHKWVIQEDLKDAGDTPFKAGDEVTLNVEHMEGMKGAKATIDTAEQTTIYMVDYTPTTGGERVKNHQWVTADGLQPVEGGEHAGH